MSTPTVFGWAADETGCGYYRIEQPLGQLAKNGWNATYSVKDEGGEAIKNADIVVGQRVCRGDATFAYMSLKAEGKHKLVYEVDDDLNTMHPTNPAYGYYSQEEVKHNILLAISVSDVVTTTTERLADALRERYGAQRVEVLPNSLEGFAYVESVPERETDEVVVGWAGGNSHWIDIESRLEYPLRQVSKADNLSFLAVGWDCRQALKLKCPSDRRDGAPIPEYYSLLDGIHIGLAPLAPTTFNEGKSPIKVMEYGARGIPYVAQDYGPYADYVDDGVDGFLCKTDRDWVEAIRTLADDEPLRMKMGQAAFDKANTYRIEDTVEKWADLYNSLV